MRVLELILLVVLAPVIAFLALVAATACLSSMGRPIVFRQLRLGRDGRPFSLLKIRSMTNEVDAAGNLLPDGDRTTRAGNFIRRFRLDELPSSINVLKGDIALVGPRPLPPAFYEINPSAKARLAVKPGFTGLSQVSGNTLLTDAEKIAVDLLYIRERSLGLDLSILLRTVWTVIGGERRDERVIRRACAEGSRSDTVPSLGEAR